MSPAFSLVARYLPASVPPLRLFVATTAVFRFQAGMSLSMRTTFTPFLIALSSSFDTAGLVGVIAMPLTPLATRSWIAERDRRADGEVDPARHDHQELPQREDRDH